MLASFRRHLNSWVAKAFFMVLVATFVLWGVGDVIRNVGSDLSVASVGGTKIEMPEMQEAYRRQLDQVTRMFGGKVDPTPDMRRGIAAQALEQLITRTAVNEAVRGFGIAVPDAALVQAVREMPAFRGPDGSFSRPTFEMVLRNNNLNEPRFMALMRADMGQRQLLDPLRAGAFSPETLTKQVYEFQNEKRVAETVSLPFADVPAPPAPTDAQIARWYENHPASYSTPEYRRIKLVLLSPEALGRDIAVSDDELKAAYEARRAEFRQPERRTLQVLVASDEAEARRLADKWAAGADWAAMQAEGATATELPNATRQEIPSAELADAAFSAAEGAVPPPLKGPLGWQVFKVTAIQPGVEQTFDQVKDALRARIAADKAADLIYERSAKIEDLLAGGTPIDELPADFGLTPLAGTLDAQGLTPDGAPAPIPGDDALRAAILREVFQARQDTPPRLIEGPRNAQQAATYFAFQIETITPPAAKPLEQVRQAVIDDWTHDERRRAQETEAARILAEVKAGKTLAEAALGHTVATLPPAGRTTGAQGLPVQMIDPLFALKQGEPTMAETADGFTVAVLARIVPADIAADPAGYGKVRDELAQAVGNDIQALLTTALRNRANPKINTAVFNSVAQTE